MSWFDPPALMPKPLPSNLVVFPPEVKKGRVLTWIVLMALFGASVFGAMGFALGWLLHLVILLPSAIRNGIIILFVIIGAAWGAILTWSLIVESVRAAQRNPSS